jgi:predicted amidohydrolase
MAACAGVSRSSPREKVSATRFQRHHGVRRLSGVHRRSLSAARIYNSVAVLQRRPPVIANHRKRVLPNYAVFDEKRYFRGRCEVLPVFELEGRASSG